MTLTAVLFSVLVAPLFLLAARLPPDFLAPVLDPPDREDDVLRRAFAGILFLLVMWHSNGERPHVHVPSLVI
jgi:hypothetical protein